MDGISIRLTGSAGVIKWGYSPAVSLGPWTLTVESDGGRLTADVQSTDAFKVEQRPLTFVMTRQNGVQWTWPVKTLCIAGRSLNATVALQE